MHCAAGRGIAIGGDTGERERGQLGRGYFPVVRPVVEEYQDLII